MDKEIMMETFYEKAELSFWHLSAKITGFLIRYKESYFLLRPYLLIPPAALIAFIIGRIIGSIILQLLSA
jgi:mannitol-specific phosphotransferase system IIBC component